MWHHDHSPGAAETCTVSKLLELRHIQLDQTVLLRSFPMPSTRNSGLPQVLHKVKTLSSCSPQHSGPECVQRKRESFLSLPGDCGRASGRPVILEGELPGDIPATCVSAYWLPGRCGLLPIPLSEQDRAAGHRGGRSFVILGSRAAG